MMNDYFIQCISDRYKYINVQEICIEIIDLSTENLLDPVLNYTEYQPILTFLRHCIKQYTPPLIKTMALL